MCAHSAFAITEILLLLFIVFIVLLLLLLLGHLTCVEGILFYCFPCIIFLPDTDYTVATYQMCIRVWITGPICGPKFVIPVHLCILVVLHAKICACF